MVTYVKSRTQRRKLERKETVEIVTNYAATLGMVIVDTSGMSPEKLEPALLLLLEARELLPPDDESATIISMDDDARVGFLLVNAPRCDDCGSIMRRI
jgi:hypothetical protein